MLTAIEIQEIAENTQMAEKAYENELIRIIDEANEECEELKNSSNNYRSVSQIIENLIDIKKKSDKRYIDAELTLRNARKEFRSMSSKF